MKFNWGHAIAITLALFMSYILYFVFSATQTVTELEAEDYYDQEIQYQQRIDAIQEGNRFKADFAFEQGEESLTVKYPKDIKRGSMTGKLILFRPGNSELDLEFPATPDLQYEQQIPLDKLQKGLYVIKIEWEQDQTAHYIEKEITIGS